MKIFLMAALFFFSSSALADEKLDDEKIVSAKEQLTQETVDVPVLTIRSISGGSELVSP